MTLRLCLLGNSHIAALRDAIQRTPDRWPDVDVTYVAAHKTGLLQTRLQGDALIPIDASAFTVFGDSGIVHLDAFDAIVVTGCEIALSRAAFLYRTARWADLPSVAPMKDATTEDWQLVSEPAFAAMLQAKFVDTLGGRLVRHLRRGTDRPIFVTSQPRTGRGVLDAGPHALDILGPIIDAGDGAEVERVFEINARVVCEAIGAGYLPQPAQTVDRHVLTKPAFTNGAIRLTREGRRPQPKSDFLHANATYGALVVDQIVEAVRAALPTWGSTGAG